MILSCSPEEHLGTTFLQNASLSNATLSVQVLPFGGNFSAPIGIGYHIFYIIDLEDGTTTDTMTLDLYAMLLLVYYNVPIF